MRKITVKAFTLVELLVVIAIIITLAGLIMSVFSRSVEKSEQVA